MSTLSRKLFLGGAALAACLLSACSTTRPAPDAPQAKAERVVHYQGRLLIYPDIESSCRPLSAPPTAWFEAKGPIVADGAAMLDISPSGHFSFSTTTDMEFAVFGTLNAAGEGAGWNWKDARKAIVTPLSPEEPAAGAGGEAIKRYVVEVQAPSGVCLYRTVLYSGEDMGPN